MSPVTVSPLRQRMIEDMNARKLCAATQRGHIHSCKRLAAFLKMGHRRAVQIHFRRTPVGGDFNFGQFAIALQEAKPARDFKFF